MNPKRTILDAEPRTLAEGLRVDQPTFHELYQASRPGVRAELIDGVVHTPSPVGSEHGRAHFHVIAWLSAYVENTPGVEGLDHASTILGPRSELEPDALLRVLPEYGGRSRDQDGYVHDAPELIVEISQSTRYIDLGPKLDVHEHAGVLEYVARSFEPDRIHWFLSRDGRFVERRLDPDGFFHSLVFPGLWLDPQALFEGDVKRLRAAVDLGCSTREHADFVAALAAARKAPNN